MAITLADYPDECLNLAGDCCWIEYSTTSLQESAYAAWQVEIYDTDIADAVDGTKLFVGGVLFTFGASADTANNIIVATVAGIGAGFTANHFINKHFDHGTSGSYAWLRPKVRSWEVSATITGLDATPSSKIISAVPTPVKAKEAYGVLVTVEQSDGEDSNIIFEATIPAEFETDFAHENIDTGSILIRKDFGHLFDAFLYPTLPTIPAVANEVTNITGLVQQFSFQAMEIWGVPTNFYGNASPVLSQSILIAKGATRINETTDLCNKSIYGCTPKTMSCNQVVMVSQYNEGGGSGTPQFIITLKDASGSTLGTGTVNGSGADTYVWTLATRIDLYSYADQVAEVRIQPKYGGFSGTANSIAVLHQNADTLVYRTSKYVYQTIMVQPVSGVEIGNATDFISKCKPCKGDTTKVVREAVNSERYMDVEFTLFNDKYYNECELQEFFSSPEVYWVVDEELYFIEPSVANTRVFERRKNTNASFKGKLKLT